jgi:hypothetical protein
MYNAVIPLHSRHIRIYWEHLFFYIFLIIITHKFETYFVTLKKLFLLFLLWLSKFQTERNSMEQLFFDGKIIITQFYTLEIHLRSLLSGMFIVSHHSQSQTQLNICQIDMKKMFILTFHSSKHMEFLRNSYFAVIHHYSHTQFQIQQNHLEIVLFRNVYRHYHSQFWNKCNLLLFSWVIIITYIQPSMKSLNNSCFQNTFHY